MRRSDRHIENNKSRLSRVEKNSYLVDEKNMNIGIGEVKNFFSREDRIKEELEKTKELQKTNTSSFKTFDIKEYINRAKEERDKELGEEEDSLINRQFSYLEELNKKYYEGVLKEKKKEETKENLFEDLLEKNEELKDDKRTISKKIKLNEEIDNLIDEKINEDPDKDVKEEDGKYVNSFYTRSMDLSRDDFIMDGEKEASGKGLMILFVILLIITIVVILLFYFGKLDFIKDLIWKKK